VVVVVVVVGDQCCTVLILRIVKQKGIGNIVCKKTQFYYDSQKEVQPTISLDGERERKKQSKQKKQSLLAAMLLVSGERERDAYLKLDCFILFGDGFVGSRIGMEKNGEEE
jgi:hypothetical protein